jgi:predicted peptidase
LILVVIVGFSSVYPFDPALDKTSKFERRYHLSVHFPFFSSYLLLLPPRYDPKTNYPMVVVLHGGHKRSLAAFVAAQDKFQERNPVFVVMPMAQFRQVWAVPPGLIREFGVTEALPTAIDVAEDLIDEFSIDRDRVYVTGSSNGAIGTFAAMAQYHNLFAAGVAVNGFWPAGQAGSFNRSNLAIYQGTEDKIFPMQKTRQLIEAIRAAGGQPKFVEMTGTGHDSWPAYRDPNLWDWLFSQSR